MIILGIETSCDETAAAVLQQKNGRIQILSNVVASSHNLQAKFGGIIPEQAAREQLKSILPVIDQALTQAFPNYHPNSKTGGKTEGSRRRARTLSPDLIGIEREDGRRETVLTGPTTQTFPYYTKNNLTPNTQHLAPSIDAITVTQGPGLIGSLLIGVETAKTLALLWNKPLIPVNHLLAHFYANWVQESLDISPLTLAKNQSISRRTNDQRLKTNDSVPQFPALGLLVSGGHTDLVLFHDHLKYTYLGGTRDDAAGECFDKCARLLGLSYPGGPEISKRAQLGNPKSYKLPRPMYGSPNFDFSFSGLKTAVAHLVDQLTHHHTTHLTDSQINDLSASIELTICQVLVKKTLKALSEYRVSHLLVAGGVAANTTLRQLFQTELVKTLPAVKLFIPPANLCTDNGASTASAGFFTPPIADLLALEANPNLSLAN